MNRTYEVNLDGNNFKVIEKRYTIEKTEYEADERTAWKVSIYKNGSFWGEITTYYKGKKETGNDYNLTVGDEKNFAIVAHKLWSEAGYGQI